MVPVVNLRNAVSVLGRFPALAGIDLEVHRGEIVLLQGPNGAGKTTVLRTCAGLVPVVQGTATVAGIDLVTEPRSVRRHVGLLGHQTGLYDDLTVTDNVRFWGRAAGSRDVDIEAALVSLGLDGRLADVAVSRLSAGQRRRTALAVLVARRPEVWLLDEPHAGLDAGGRDLVDTLVVGAADAGATVLMASHELDRATTVATRVVVIAGGVVRADEPAARRDRPARRSGEAADVGFVGEAVGDAG